MSENYSNIYSESNPNYGISKQEKHYFEKNDAVELINMDCLDCLDCMGLALIIITI